MTLELLGYACAYVFVLFWGGEIFPEPTDLMSYLFLGLSSVTVLSSITLLIMWTRAMDSMRAVGITSVLLLLFYTNSTYTWPVNPHIALFFTLFLIYSSRGNVKVWLFSLFFTILLFAHLLGQTPPLTAVDTTTLAGFSLIFSLGSFLSSYFTLREQRIEHDITTKEEVLKSRKTLSDEAEELLQQQQSSSESETPEFDISKDENLKDLISKEMDYVVYFVERIFHPHSTIAFIHDGTNSENKKTLSIYSAKSKGMNIDSTCTIVEGEGIIGEVAKTKQPFISGNLTLYSKDIGYYKGNEAIQFLVAVPIISRTNRFLGVLAIDFREKSIFREHHKDAIHRFAKIAASLLTNIHLRKKEQENAARFHLFYETSRSISSTNNNIEILKHVLRAIKKTGPIFRTAAVAYFPESNTCQIIAVDCGNREIIKGFSFPASNSIIASTLTKNAIEYVSDYLEIREATPVYAKGEMLNKQIRSILAIPFKNTGTNYKLAVIAESTEKGIFNERAYRDNINILVKNGSTAYEKAILYQQMQLQATTDGLTGLVNHRTFQEHLHEHILRSHRYERKLSLLLMDIDHFKDFNDTYGHQIGDLVLKTISKCLKKSVRSSDLVARYGGEEFVVILPETNIPNAEKMAERIRVNIEKQRISVEEKQLSVTVSIGAATLDEHASSQSKLIEAADAAMYHSKRNGRNQVTVFEDGMEPQS